MIKRISDDMQLLHSIVEVGKRNDTSQVQFLIINLLHENANIRKACVSALGRLRYVAAEGHIINLLSDTKPIVRLYAINALGKIGGQQSVEPLTERKEFDEKPYNNYSADLALQKIHKRLKQKYLMTTEKPTPVKTETSSSKITKMDKNLTDFLSPDQTDVLEAIIGWINQRDVPFITLGGYAGTGKTTLVSVLRNILRKQQPKKKVAFASFTGKASQVLKQKLTEQHALYTGDTCSTIHSLMYSPEVDDDGRIISWNRSKKLEFDLIIIDEASMVTSDIWRDLLSYNLPIIAVGDHGQLPPVESSGFNLMDNPQLRLEKIHRQAQGNPIIEVATMAREHGEIPFQISPTVMKVRGDSDEATQIFERIAQERTQDKLILCSRNRTRIRLNKNVRGLLEIESVSPQVGETLICLKNNYDTNCGPIFNGMIGTVQSLTNKDPHWYEATIQFHDDGRVFQGDISKHQFHQERYLDKVDGVHYSKIGDRFDFGYVLTVHKAQGSQAKKVLLFEEYAPYMKGIEWNRWLYTAVTRASEELYIIG